MKHAAAAGLLGAALIAGGASAQAGARTGLEVQTLVLIRTTSGPASFQLTVQGSPDATHPHGFDGEFSARVDHGRLTRAESLGAATFDYDFGPEVRAAGQSVSVCRPLGGCIVNRTLAYGIGVDSSDKGGPDVDNRLYVVEEGPAAITFHAIGWTLRREHLSYRYVAAAAADAYGAFTGVNSVEEFFSASAPGGLGGSIATGEPPCSFSTAGLGAEPVPRGVGRSTLTGGPKPVSLTCPQNIGQPFLTSLANSRTTWRLDGPVLGDDTGVNVPLFVMDLPRNP